MKSFRLLALLTALLISLASPRAAQAATRIVLDGEFDDWGGKAHLDDPPGDARRGDYDLVRLYWANNPDQARLYFMVERLEHHKNDHKPVLYVMFIDTDNDGRFNGPADARVDVRYAPKSLGLVTVMVFRGPFPVAGYGGLWGETSDEGGTRCEWPVEFSDIDIEPGQVIRMVLFATDNPPNRPSIGAYENLASSGKADRLPDSGDIQWAPVPTAPSWFHLVPLAMCVLAAGRFYSWRKRTSYLS
ncbi:MAG: hypothetical protein HPY55_00510 [Firmicutes bacterium]|nr:hypothetical protein [Bacillota bacterium]